jgi:hypothetical protein
LPNDLAHVILEFADRHHSQHLLGMMSLVLCTLGLYAQVGQAGIGGIDALVPKIDWAGPGELI